MGTPPTRHPRLPSPGASQKEPGGLGKREGEGGEGLWIEGRTEVFFMDVRAGCPSQNACFPGFGGPDRSFWLDVAGISGPKLPLGTDFSFLSIALSVPDVYSPDCGFRTGQTIKNTQRKWPCPVVASIGSVLARPLGIFPCLVVQHCDPPYRAIGYSYAYRIYVFPVYRRVSRYTPPLLGASQNYVGGGGGLGGVWGGVSQLKPALCAIGRYRGVSQLYCRKSRLDGPLSSHGFKHPTDLFICDMGLTDNSFS